VITDEQLAKCGVNFGAATNEPEPAAQVEEKPAGEEDNDNFKIPDSQRYSLAAAYLVCSLLSGVVVALLVDPLSRYTFITPHYHADIAA